MITVETARVKWDRWDADKVDRVHRAIGHQVREVASLIWVEYAQHAAAASLAYYSPEWD